MSMLCTCKIHYEHGDYFRETVYRYSYTVNSRLDSPLKRQSNVCVSIDGELIHTQCFDKGNPNTANWPQ